MLYSSGAGPGVNRDDEETSSGDRGLDQNWLGDLKRMLCVLDSQRCREHKRKSLAPEHATCILRDEQVFNNPFFNVPDKGDSINNINQL